MMPPQGSVSLEDIFNIIDSIKDIPDGIAGLDKNGLIKLAELKVILGLIL